MTPQCCTPREEGPSGSRTSELHRVLDSSENVAANEFFTFDIVLLQESQEPFRKSRGGENEEMERISKQNCPRIPINECSHDISNILGLFAREHSKIEQVQRKMAENSLI